MSELVIVGISAVIAVVLPLLICRLIVYYIDKCVKEVHYVYKSRKLNKTIDVDKVGE